MTRLLFRVVEMPWFYWTIRAIFWAFAKVAFGLRVDDVERLPREGGLVLAVNHISTLDPPMMGAAMPREISFMAKKELFERLGPALLYRGLHAFPVDRSRSDVGAIKEAMRRLQAGRAVGVFIQGTRNRGDTDAMDGASYLAGRAGVPLQPAAIFREGRRFRVRFGEPFAVEGRDRASIRAATETAMARIVELLPSQAGVTSGEDLASAPAGEEADAPRS